MRESADLRLQGWWPGWWGSDSPRRATSSESLRLRLRKSWRFDSKQLVVPAAWFYKKKHGVMLPVPTFKAEDGPQKKLLAMLFTDNKQKIHHFPSADVSISEAPTFHRNFIDTARASRPMEHMDRSQLTNLGEENTSLTPCPACMFWIRFLRFLTKGQIIKVDDNHGFMACSLPGVNPAAPKKPPAW